MILSTSNRPVHMIKLEHMPVFGNPELGRVFSMWFLKKNQSSRTKSPKYSAGFGDESEGVGADH